MNTDKNKNLNNDDLLDEVPGYGIGVLPEDLYKPDLPSSKCPNGKSVKPAIKNTGKDTDTYIKQDDIDKIPPGLDADAASG